MTRATLARVPAPLALRQADSGMRAAERMVLERSVGGSQRLSTINPFVTATLALPLNGLTIMAPQPEMLS